MQRLFSMFPAGRPGLALLLLRCALAVMLTAGVAGPYLLLGYVWFLLAPAAVAIALALGFLTPIVSGLCILLQLTTLVTSAGTVGAVHVCAVLVALSLALLGPGAYSMDARLFGRRQLVLPTSEDESGR